MVKTFNGFVPVLFTQIPSAGTSLRFGTTTQIKVMAVDLTNRTASCKWEVNVPGLQVLTSAYRAFRSGTYQTIASFKYFGGSSSGIGYELRCVLRRKLVGQALMTGVIQKGNYTYRSSRFTLEKNQTNVTVKNLKVQNPAKLRLRLSVRNNKDRKANAIDCYLYGQIK